ncbi:MAG: hypothetical protein Q8Q60_03030 [Candidatus Chromulinivorax sp.]|nr:hypothetical protein [Candidatus Chromulinivorax sp.]
MKNKLFLVAVLLIVSALNLQASSQNCTYEWSCINPEQITIIYFDGREEKIVLQPGENSREKIRELQEADVMRKKQHAQANNSSKAGSAKSGKQIWEALACITSLSGFKEYVANDPKLNSLNIPIIETPGSLQELEQILSQLGKNKNNNSGKK